MTEQTIIIPTNFTDSGKLFGLFEKRNAVEAVCLALPVLFLIVTLSPFNLNINIIGGAVILVPLCGFALLGIRDYSLTGYLRIYYYWRKHCRKITYKGSEKECSKRKRQ